MVRGGSGASVMAILVAMSPPTGSVLAAALADPPVGPVGALEPLEAGREVACCGMVPVPVMNVPPPPPPPPLLLLLGPSSCALAEECCLEEGLCTGLLVLSALAALALRLRLRNEVAGLLLPSGQLPRYSSTSGFSEKNKQ